MVTSGLALAAHFGDGVLRAGDVAAGIVGAVVKDPVQDRVVWQEYLETVVKRARELEATSTAPAASVGLTVSRAASSPRRSATTGPARPARCAAGPRGAARPTCVLIEGPPEPDALVALAGRRRTCGRRSRCSSTRSDEPAAAPRSARSPSSRRSGRRSAGRSAHGVPVRFFDLPAAHALALAQRWRRAPTADGTDDAAPTPPRATAPARRPDRRCSRPRPATTTPSAGGRTSSSTGATPRSSGSRRSPRRWPRCARRRRADDPDAREARREAYMRRRSARRCEGRRRADRGRLRRLARAGADRRRCPPRRTTTAAQRAAQGQGRGDLGAVDARPARAGAAATAPASPRPAGTTTCSTTARATRRVLATRWLVARGPRAARRGLDAVAGHVIEAVRLAEALAALRGRPSRRAGRGDRGHPGGAVRRRRPAARADRPAARRRRALGAVPDGTPMVPLAADLAPPAARAAAQADGRSTTVDLDLRRDTEPARSPPAAPAAAARRRRGASRPTPARHGHVPGGVAAARGSRSSPSASSRPACYGTTVGAPRRRRGRRARRSGRRPGRR